VNPSHVAGRDRVPAGDRHWFGFTTGHGSITIAQAAHGGSTEANPFCAPHANFAAHRAHRPASSA
jgi:hypothetical protein